jgi:hypothetical protein
MTRKDDKCLPLGIKSKYTKFNGPRHSCLACIFYKVFLRSDMMTLTFDMAMKKTQQ